MCKRDPNRAFGPERKTPLQNRQGTCAYLLPVGPPRLQYVRTQMRSGRTMHLTATAFCKLVLRRWIPALSFSISSLLTCAAADLSTAGDDRVWPPWDRGAVTFGGYLIALNSSVSFGVNKVPGLSINAEDLLGLSSSLFVMGGS